MRFNHLQADFGFGELSPLLRGRTDSDIYKKGLEKAYNMIGLPQGGMSAILGSTRVAHARGAKWVLTFEPTTTESYEILIDTGTIGALTAKTATAIDQDGVVFTVLINAYAGYSVNAIYQYVQINDTLVICTDSLPIVIQRKRVNGVYYFTGGLWGKYYSGLTGEILAHPFKDRNTSSTTLRWTGTQLISSSSTFFEAGHTEDTAADNGAIFKLTSSSGKTYAFRVDDLVDGSTVNCTFIGVPTMLTPDVGSLSATTAWEESAWSKKAGYPRAVTAFESSLVFGGTNDQPDTVWKSKVGNIFHLMVRKYEQDLSSDTTGLIYFGAYVNSDPYSQTSNSPQVGRILWMYGDSDLIVGSSNSVTVLSGGDSAVGINNVPVSYQADSYGTSSSYAVKIDTGIYYISADANKIVKLSYTDAKKSYVPVDITLLSPQMAKKGLTTFSDVNKYGFVKVTLDQRNNILYCQTYAGTIVACVISEVGEVTSWSELSEKCIDLNCANGRCFYLATSGYLCFIDPYYKYNYLNYLEGNSSFRYLNWEKLNRSILLNQFRWIAVGESFPIVEADTSALTRSIKVDEKVYNYPTGTLTYAQNSLQDGDMISLVPTAGTWTIDGNVETGNTTFFVNLYTAGGQQYIQLRKTFGAGSALSLSVTGGATANIVRKTPTRIYIDTTEASATIDGKVYVWRYGSNSYDIEEYPITTKTNGYVEFTPSTALVAGDFVGFGHVYKSVIISLPVEAGMTLGTAQHSIKRIHEIGIRFHNSLGCGFGKDENSLEELVLDSDDGALYTGVKKVSFGSSPEQEAQVVIEQSGSLPMTILSLTYMGVTQDQGG